MAVTCKRCSKSISKSPMAGTGMQLYNGVICQSCRAVECMECKQEKGRIDAPCSWCSGAVSPAFEHLM